MTMTLGQIIEAIATLDAISQNSDARTSYLLWETMGLLQKQLTLRSRHMEQSIQRGIEARRDDMFSNREGSN